ncbi:MAG: tetratricopeptide repeat protein [Alphaproteobacteria bacterium]
MKNPRLWRARLALLALAFALVVVPPAMAQQAVPELLREGLELLRARDYAPALEKFTAATEVDPSAGGAWLLKGMAENRLGLAASALLSLERARALEVAPPRIDFEMGWAQVELFLFEPAVEHLERYEAARPGEAKTSEFLGRAYMGLDRFDEAEAQFKEAIRRDPAVKATVLYRLAQLERARENDEAAAAYLRRLLEEAPEAPLAVTIREELARLAPPPRPWHVGGAVSYGFNDNVLAVPNALVLPTDVTTSQSHFIAFSADARYDWWITRRDVLTPGYVFSGVEYDDVDTADFQDHLFYLNYAHGLGPNLEAAGRISYARTIVNGSGLRDELALRPSVAWRAFRGATIEAAYRFADSDYFTTPTSTARNRDSRTHTASLSGFYTIPNPPVPAWARLGYDGPLPVNLRFGYAATVNAANGTDFDFIAHTISPGINLTLPYEVILDLSFTFTDTNFDKRNSLASTAGTLFAFARDDGRKVYRAGLSRVIYEGSAAEFIPRVEAFGEFRRTANISNIPFFEYDQTIWSFGLRARL